MQEPSCRGICFYRHGEEHSDVAISPVSGGFINPPIAPNPGRKRGLLNSAHDCSDGGLLVCLAESCIQGKIGLTCDKIKSALRLDSLFFGEAQSRIVVSLSPHKAGKLLSLAKKLDVPALRLGTTGGDRLLMEDYLNLSLSRLGDAWLGGLIK
jgi:phosphoribosylformylglycinamidine (FGAM) synthase-like enzyme